MMKKIIMSIAAIAMVTVFVAAAYAQNNGNKATALPLAGEMSTNRTYAFNCNMTGDKFRVWPVGNPDNEGGTWFTNNGSQEGQMMVFMGIRQEYGYTWLLAKDDGTPEDKFICPNCGETNWISYSNQAGMPNGNNIQLVCAAEEIIIPDVPVVHKAKGDFFKLTEGYWNASGNACADKDRLFTFNIYCDDCCDDVEECFVGTCSTDLTGKVSFTIKDSVASGLEPGGNVCHFMDLLGRHFVIREVLPVGSPWSDGTLGLGLGFTVVQRGFTTEGDAVFDEGLDEYDNEGVVINKDFYMYVHLNTSAFPGGGTGSKTATVVGGNNLFTNPSGSQGDWFTYFKVSGLSLTEPQKFAIVNGSGLVPCGWLVVSLNTDLDLVLTFYAAGPNGTLGDRITNPGTDNLDIRKTTDPAYNFSGNSLKGNVTGYKSSDNPIVIKKATWTNLIGGLAL